MTALSPTVGQTSRTFLFHCFKEHKQALRSANSVVVQHNYAISGGHTIAFGCHDAVEIKHAHPIAQYSTIKLWYAKVELFEPQVSVGSTWPVNWDYSVVNVL